VKALSLGLPVGLLLPNAETRSVPFLASFLGGTGPSLQI